MKRHDHKEPDPPQARQPSINEFYQLIQQVERRRRQIDKDHYRRRRNINILMAGIIAIQVVAAAIQIIRIVIQ